MNDDLNRAHSNDFEEIITIIEKARYNAYRAVNCELINMYWDIGEYVSQRVSESGWGNSTVKEFSNCVQSRFVGIKGFSPQNIWRMKQFYETYSINEKLSPLVREISWTNNILILMAAKTDEEREFYLVLSANNRYSKRELERQIDSGLYERSMMSEVTNKLITERNEGLSVLRDSYVLEFLNLPDNHKEEDIRKAIANNLKKFVLEFGKDFTFIGDEYRIQVGNSDFRIDLLFHNRELRCLVAIELKIGRFKPEHLGKMEFYLEALDRDVKKESENPSVGLILCTKKDEAVVEYALSRSLSPAMIAEYKLRLPDKRMLEKKLRELAELAESASSEEN